MASPALTSHSALRLACEVADIIVKPPLTFVAAESNIKDVLRVRVIDPETDLEKQRYVQHDCSVHIFRTRLMTELAEMQRCLRDEKLLHRAKLAS